MAFFTEKILKFIWNIMGAQSLSHVQLSATLWTVAHQDPLHHEIFQARILEWIAIFYSKGSSWPRNQTQVSYIFCIGRQILYHCATQEAYMEYQGIPNSQNNFEKEEQSWRPHSLWFCAIWQSYSDQKQYSIGLKYSTVQYWPVFHFKPMEQNRDPRSKPSHTWSNYFWQGFQDRSIRRR